MHGEPTGSTGSNPTPTPRRLQKRTWIAIGTASTFLVASIAAAFVLDSDPQETGFLELYITDLPANFTRFDVRIAAVEFGAQRTPLELERRDFDLLSLRGPEDALRIARGSVPVGGQADEIRIRFESGTLTLDHQRIPVDIPDAVLAVGHDFRLADGLLRSVLFDINVDDSLTIDGPRIVFEPTVQAVYVVAEGAISGSSERTERVSGPVDFAAAPPEPPQRQVLQETPKESTNPFAKVSRTTTGGSTVTATVTSTTTATKSPPTTSSAPEPDSEDDWMPSPGDAASTVPDYGDTILGWFIQYAPNTTDLDQAKKDIEALGGEILYRFESLPAVYVAGQEFHAINVTRHAWVEHVEPVVPISLHLASSKPAVRANQIGQALTALKDASGRPIDGRGIGVAVVDTGIDGLHPDLTHFLVAGNGAAVRVNFKVVSNSLVDLVHTDTTSGHGTHVAGIVAGRGTKDVSLKGVAPGATLHGFGIGELTNTLWANQAFDWILTHGHKQNPPVKIVTNSWGTQGAYDPNSLTSRLVNSMVAKGMVVVFSAGNAGGDGNAGATTSPECQNPTPGVICVAWYDDVGGSRDGEVAPKSSRGSKDHPNTWPDVSAPGSSVRSARTPFGWVTGIGLTDYYVTLEGSSMAAPHVAGAAALMLQANPGMTPAQVESLVKSTAYKYEHDGPYSGSGSHHAKGHGLLDAYAAVAAAQAS